MPETNHQSSAPNKGGRPPCPQGALVGTRDDDGSEIVLVEIVCRPGVFAKLDRVDFERWTAAGREPRFILSRNGPYTGTYRVGFANRDVRGGFAGLARELLGAEPGQVVTYLDGNQLNLRRSNLVLRTGRARGASLAPRLIEATHVGSDI